MHEATAVSNPNPLQGSLTLESGVPASTAGIQRYVFHMPVIVRSFREWPLYIHAPVRFWPANSQELHR